VNDPFASAESYELFLYTLSEQFPSVRGSTVTFTRRGYSLAVVSWELLFDFGYRIVVRERVIYDRLPLVLDGYGYEIWRGEEKLCWYDPQPHPGDASLEPTFPHHKHVPPDMKHHRIPAQRMSFTQPNLPILIEEVEKLLTGSRISPKEV
jgi:hypothetical protein